MQIACLNRTWRWRSDGRRRNAAHMQFRPRGFLQPRFDPAKYTEKELIKCRVCACLLKTESGHKHTPAPNVWRRVTFPQITNFFCSKICQSWNGQNNNSLHFLQMRLGVQNSENTWDETFKEQHILFLILCVIIYFIMDSELLNESSEVINILFLSFQILGQKGDLN